ncbi:hypothetical protein [Streptomyces sp. NPDC017556]|uniref:hypothetical protein n=1 Tax=Streptomyces sp. NPDC017556 TaxID=3365002 RepID=UPI0037A1AFC5
MCDGRGTPLKVVMTAANVNDVTRTLALVDGIPPVAGRPAGPAVGPTRCSVTRATTPTRTGTRYASDESCLSSRARAARTSRRRADLRPAPPLQASRRPLGTPHRTPRRLRLPRLQPDLLETPQDDPHMIVLRALNRAGQELALSEGRSRGG